MTKIFEDEKLARENYKKEFSDEMKNLEIKLRNLLIEERQVGKFKLKNDFF
jgi:hypothetical protein